MYHPTYVDRIYELLKENVEYTNSEIEEILNLDIYEKTRYPILRYLKRYSNMKRTYISKGKYKIVIDSFIQKEIFEENFKKFINELYLNGSASINNKNDIMFDTKDLKPKFTKDSYIDYIGDESFLCVFHQNKDKLTKEDLFNYFK